MIPFWSISFSAWSMRAWSKGEYRLVVVSIGVVLPVLMTCWNGNEIVVGLSDELISSRYWAKTFCALFSRTSLLNVTCALLIWWLCFLVNRGIGFACGNVRWYVSKTSWALLKMNQSHLSVSVWGTIDAKVRKRCVWLWLGQAWVCRQLWCCNDIGVGDRRTTPWWGGLLRLKDWGGPPDLG